MKQQNLIFFKTQMPGNSRLADYYLGCLNGCVYIDFNLNEDHCIYLLRISFDGYGCCRLADNVIPMTKEETLLFIENHKKLLTDDYIEDNQTQNIINKIVKDTIKNNKKYIWKDALQKYKLIE